MIIFIITFITHINLAVIVINLCILLKTHRKGLSMSKKQSLKELLNIIDQFSKSNNGLLYKNTFAIACHLSLEGKNKACHKMLKCLFDELGREKREIYFSKISASIDTYAKEYVSDISANLEINKLIFATDKKEQL